MATVTERFAQNTAPPLLCCDLSPPRSGNPQFTQSAAGLDVDFFSVAYSPGQSVRMDTVAAAATLKWHLRKDVICNIATRDMNRLAVQMHLLGAQALDLENVLVVKGDDFNIHDRDTIKTVADFRPTELVTAIKQMNQGIDFRGKKLSAPTNFCVGTIMDPTREVGREARLAAKKLAAGSDYFITQSIYDAAPARALLQRFQEETGAPLTAPVFWGINIMVRDGVVFGEVPSWVQRDLAQGRSGVDLALQTIHELQNAGCRAFYLVPPILKGGKRDYAAVQAVCEAVQASARR